MMTPIYVNVRDRYTMTRSLVEYLQTVPGAVPIIVDNDSSYPPLLEWYTQNPCEVVRTGRNGGTLAAYRVLLPAARHRARFGTDLFGITDPDLDLSGVPTDLLEVLEEGVRRWPGRSKAGLSLEIDDLPDTKLGRDAREWETKYWQKPLDERFFDAPVDTTFFLSLAGRPFGYDAVRTNRPHVAKHRPWYFDPENLDEEERYYLEHVNPHGTMWTARLKKGLQ